MCPQVIDAEFRHKFRVLVFAILEDGNSVSAINPRGNGKPFAEAFDTQLLTMAKLAEHLNAIKATK